MKNKFFWIDFRNSVFFIKVHNVIAVPKSDKPRSECPLFYLIFVIPGEYRHQCEDTFG